MKEALELKLENNGMKIEILNLRVQLAQALMPQVQQEREELIAAYKAAEEAEKASQAAKE